MKKKFTAIITACAMMATMTPLTAFAASNDTAVEQPSITTTTNQSTAISINVFGFNNNPERDEVYVQVNGGHKGDRIFGYIEGVAEPVLFGFLNSDDTNEFTFKKTNIPNIDDPYANNKLTITIFSEHDSSILHTQTFTQSYSSTTAEKVEFNLKDASGNKGRQIDVKFDANYYPGTNDAITIEGLDSTGKVVGRKTTYDLDRYDLSDDVDDNNMRAMRRPITVDLDANAVSVRLSFYSGGKEMSQFTKTLSLAPKYGTFAKLELYFDNTEIYRGDKVTGTLYYVNTEGKRYDVSDQASMKYIDGGLALASSNPNKPEFTVKDNATIGTNVTVIASYGGYDKTAAKLFTVSEKLTNNKVKMSTNTVSVGNKTNITFTLQNGNGNTTTLDFKPTKVNFRFLEASDSEAKFNFTAASLSSLATNGTMSGYVECDKPCTGKLELTFSDDKGNKYRVLSDTLTFSDKKDPEKRTVTLKIGSNVIDINGESKTLDIGPIIYQSRTFVPLRHVIEAFDADCNWDSKTNKITIKYADKTIEMSPGSANYTINGKAQPAMDVTPYIVSGANRTMVPLRFVGEAMGFDVESVPYPNGLGVEKIVITNSKN